MRKAERKLKSAEKRLVKEKKQASVRAEKTAARPATARAAIGSMGKETGTEITGKTAESFVQPTAALAKKSASPATRSNSTQKTGRPVTPSVKSQISAAKTIVESVKVENDRLRDDYAQALSARNEAFSASLIIDDKTKDEIRQTQDELKRLTRTVLARENQLLAGERKIWAVTNLKSTPAERDQFH